MYSNIIEGGISLLPFLLVIKDEETRDKLEQIYNNYKKNAYWTAYNILKDYHESEDVVQDGIIKMSSLIDKIDEIRCNKTRALFVIIVRNLSLNIYNRKKKIKYTSNEDMEFISKDLSLDEEMIRLDEVKWIADSLEKINPSYADIITLKYYYDYSNLEIAKLLDISEGNVRVKLHRARISIKNVLDQEVDHNGFE